MTTEDQPDILPNIANQKMSEIWQKVKAGESDQLSGEEQQIAAMMLNHADEYGRDFDSLAEDPDRFQAPDSEYNPLLHISIHTAIENQLQAKGYGSSEPLADNNSESGRALNRRVELRRVGTEPPSPPPEEDVSH